MKEKKQSIAFLISKWIFWQTLLLSICNWLGSREFIIKTINTTLDDKWMILTGSFVLMIVFYFIGNIIKEYNK